MSRAALSNAISDAIASGTAILKFITANDVGLTGGKQRGYYLPRPAWKLYTRQSPKKGMNADIPVRITWPEWGVTESRVKWYGKHTRSEYRLTRFGKGFPWLSAEQLGSLLVLIPRSFDDFTAYVFGSEDEISEIQATLGIEIIGSFAIYGADREATLDVDECLKREFEAFVASLNQFPSGRELSNKARAALTACLKGYDILEADLALLRCIDAEYNLFRIVERKLCEGKVTRGFTTLDSFLDLASSILNRRKARAGRSLENHVEHLLTQAGVPFEMRPNVDGRPDIVIPSRDSYVDPNYPINRLFVIGVKTTCKDRWRQVLREGRRQPHKHIITLQQGISTSQLKEMHEANVSLVVPEPLHKPYYPKKSVDEAGIEVLGVSAFIRLLRSNLGQPATKTATE